MATIRRRQRHSQRDRAPDGRPRLATDLYPARGKALIGSAALAVRHLSWPGVLHDVTLEIRRGEIVGLAGLMGSGRTSLARAIFGAEPQARGDISVDGKAVRIRSPRTATRAGVGLLTEDRKYEGLAMNRDGVENISAVRLPTRAGFVRRSAQRQQAVSIAAKVRLAPKALRRAVRTLSEAISRKSCWPSGWQRGLTGADSRRADARYRCRRQSRNLCNHAPTRRRGTWHPVHFLGAA